MNLYRHLDRARVQFDVALYEGAPCRYEEELTSLGARVFRYPPPSPTGLRRLRRRLTSLLRENGPYAAVHSQMFLFSGLPLAAAHSLGVPVRIAHSHGTPERGRTAAVRWCRAYLLGQVRRHATHLAGCSPAALEAMLGPQVWQDPRAQVIPNAIPLGAYATLPHERAAARAELGWTPEGPWFGYVGRLSGAKNLSFLQQLLTALLQVVPTAQCVIVGEGGLGRHLEQWRGQQAGRDRIHLLGWRQDVPQLLAGLDVVLLPSYSEGLPLVAIEAQAAGTPILCSEAVPPEADLGLGLVQRLPLDQGAGPWLAALSEALEIPRPSWERRRERFAATGYDAAALARRMEAVYLGAPALRDEVAAAPEATLSDLEGRRRQA